jgi:hypothetical protein
MRPRHASCVGESCATAIHPNDDGAGGLGWVVACSCLYPAVEQYLVLCERDGDHWLAGHGNNGSEWSLGARVPTESPRVTPRRSSTAVV